VLEVLADDGCEVEVVVVVLWLAFAADTAGAVEADDGADWFWLLVILAESWARAPSGTADDLSMMDAETLGVRVVSGDYACQQGVG
jgi:hypothetical protein